MRAKARVGRLHYNPAWSVYWVPQFGVLHINPKHIPSVFQGLSCVVYMRAVAGRRVGHVETIQTWRAAPCDYPPTYSAFFNNSMYLFLLLSYISRCWRCMPAEDLPFKYSTRCVSHHIHAMPCVSKNGYAKQYRSLHLH